jgi:hypothetical protein
MGGNLITIRLIKFLLLKEYVVHEYSAPHIHTQNGRAEVLNRIILEKAESMRTHAECPQSWWEFSFHAAVHIYI